MSHIDDHCNENEDLEMADVPDQEEMEVEEAFSHMQSAREGERIVGMSAEQEDAPRSAEQQEILWERGYGPLRHPRDLMLTTSHDAREIPSDHVRSTMPVYLHEGIPESIQMPMEHESYHSHSSYRKKAAFNRHDPILRSRFARYSAMKREDRNTLQQLLGNATVPDRVAHAAPGMSGIMPLYPSRRVASSHTGQRKKQPTGGDWEGSDKKVEHVVDPTEKIDTAGGKYGD